MEGGTKFEGIVADEVGFLLEAHRLRGVGLGGSRRHRHRE